MPVPPSRTPHARAFLPPVLRRWGRLPSGAWAALAWCAGTAFAFLSRVRLPGEAEPTVHPGVYLYRWDGLTVMALATAATLAGAGLLRRRPPVALALMLAGAVIASTALSVAEIPLAQFLAVDVALYAIAATRPRRTGIAATGTALGVLAGYLAVRLSSGWSVGTSAELSVALTAVVAWLLGDAARQSREHADRVRAQAAEQAITAERLRIARELHDMVAHSIGIVALQAGAASRVIETRPADAREALAAIETSGRETLSGLRRMMGALRQSEPGSGAPRVPLPGPGLGPGGLGLADVGRLAAATTAAGVRVDVEWRGEPGPLPPEIDRSAYRIVQEAVTNVVRHAGAGSCRVTVGRAPDGLSIEVTDDGAGRPGEAGGTGWGLTGMRERVRLLDGEFAAGPRPGGGFRVAARLPVRAGAR
ncbi:sensor histidine kinase [Streptomyces sp. F63]|uniref:sensor histidine kinase n=1 Tax=Streptomyces sp. F63 TaxID=2824887 RepID=UPI001B3651A3|nr:sensor histidine kinase [Streptomyces sp. F63]MBQ0988137.1 sensor histidine kinase [Streptomyces sp. F63]